MKVSASITVINNQFSSEAGKVGENTKEPSTILISSPSTNPWPTTVSVNRPVVGI